MLYAARGVCASQRAFESDALNEYDRRFFQNITEDKAEITDYQYALGKLSAMLTTCYQSKTIIIIDEYDTPIQQGHLHHYYDEVIGFMRNLYPLH